jgi:hypothetical protein
MLDLPAAIDAWDAAPAGPAWPDHEYVKGWGVFGLPFDTGHVLALRVFPHSTFGSYHTVWLRDPAGSWAIHVDGPRLETACPRYFGPACDHVGFATIGLDWTGPDTLRITADAPGLDVTLTARETAALRMANAMASAMPMWTWRSGALRGMRQLMARMLGMGRIELHGVTPSGHLGTSMPQRMYAVEEAHGTLAGTDIGRPVRLRENPDIGGAPLPARGVISIGQAVWEPVPVRAPA